MTLPMGRITRDYLLNHKLTPHQSAFNLFRVLGCIDALNEQIGLGLTWQDVVHMYECHKLASAGYYLKSRSDVVRMISCLPKSNKGMKDNFLVVSGEWSDGLYCPTRAGDPGGVPQEQVPKQGFQFSYILYIFHNYFNISPSRVIVSTFLTTIASSDMVADKSHVTPRFSHVNVPGLNKLLRSKVFIIEDEQLCATHLILDYEPLSRIFQDVGQAIRACDSRLNRMDVSKPGFLARRDLPPVELPIQCAPLQVASLREEFASSRYSLDAEIDQF